MLVRIVHFKKGHEGQGFTHYAIQNMQDYHFLARDGQFSVSEVSDNDVLTFSDKATARKHAKAANWSVEN